MASKNLSQLPAVSTSSGADLYYLVQSAADSSITFSNLQSAIIAGASAAPYTPADSSKWAGAAPTTIKQALDRIAAVVGASVPIP